MAAAKLNGCFAMFYLFRELRMDTFFEFGVIVTTYNALTGYLFPTENNILIYSNLNQQTFKRQTANLKLEQEVPGKLGPKGLY